MTVAQHPSGKVLKEKRIFLAYEFTLLAKGAQAFLEIVAGVLFAFVSTNAITTFVFAIAHSELVETPKDIFSTLLTKGLDQFSAAGKYFLVLYLLSHGIIKLVIIIGLFLKKKWSYPAALIGFGALIIYQSYEIGIKQSLLLIVFTLIDIVILWLIVREHNVPKRYTE